MEVEHYQGYLPAGSVPPPPMGLPGNELGLPPRTERMRVRGEGQNAIPCRHPDEFHSFSDEDLVTAAQGGMSSALDELLKRHHTLVLRTARRMTETPEEASDVVQEAMLHAFVNIARFRGDARFSSWLTAIVINEARTVRRKNSRVHLTYLDAPIGTDGLSPADMLVDTRRNPEQECLRNEICVLVRSSVLKQDPQSRVILRACYLEGMSIEDIARALGITQSAAKSRLLRARRKLSRVLRRRARIGELQ